MRSLVALVTIVVAVSTSCVSSATVTLADGAVAEATRTAALATPTPDPNATPPAGTSPGPDPAPTEDVVGPTATASPRESPAGEPTPAPAAGTENATDFDTGCRFDSIDSFGDVQIELAFIGDTSRPSDTIVRYDVTDGNGEIFIDSSTLIEDLGPGEAVRMVVDTVENAPNDPAARDGISCRLLGTDAFDFPGPSNEPQAGDACRFDHLDAFDDIQLVVDVANPTDETAELILTIALRGPDGVRFGDAIGFTDTVPPGERVVSEVDSLTEFPSWVDAGSFSCEILAVDTL